RTLPHSATAALPDAVLGPKRDDDETTSPPAEITLPAMVLNTHSIYPTAGRYVLRLHRDARPENGHLSGRIEHVSSGDSIDFATGAELLAWLARHAAETSEPPADSQTAPKEPR
ncbi:MAG TPA: hypothetical protein VLJ62_11700, partial [Burkholderiaceae bacterium]|nr:hypothetical protein [Burkholderiaceae bacterium]